MQKKTKVTSETRIQVVKKYLASEAGLLSSNKSYTSETKVNTVTDYLDGNGSLNEVCFRYKISSYSVLQHWINVVFILPFLLCCNINLNF